MTNPLSPSPGLLCKLGSMVVHCEEILSPDRHQFDVDAFNSLKQDAEVRAWIDAMDAMAFLPKRRK